MPNNPSLPAITIARHLMEELAADNGCSLAFDDQDHTAAKAHTKEIDDGTCRHTMIMFVRLLNKNMLERAVHRALLAGHANLFSEETFVESLVYGSEDDPDDIANRARLPNPHLQEISDALNAIFEDDDQAGEDK